MAPTSADPTNVTHNNDIHTADEHTPLLLAPGTVPPGQSNGHVVDPKAQQHDNPIHLDATGSSPTEERPMPYVQVMLICFSSLADPIAYFAIFPFINEMLHRTGGVPEQNVGFWAGTIESLFSGVQMVLMIFYGRAADRLGRKPVLVFSLVGIAVSTALFGMSQKLWVMVVLRCIGGMFGGSVVTIRTMLSEITTKETQGRAFSWYMFVKQLGILIGPLIGGGLANPTEQFPSVFGGIAFLEDHPYALGTFIAGMVTLTSAFTTLFFVEETLRPKVVGDTAPEPPMTTWQVLKSPGVPMVLFIMEHISLLSLAYTAVSPTMMYTSVKRGGFGFSDQQIALIIMDAGTFQALWILLVFPYLQKNYGTGFVLRAASVASPFFMAAYPLANELLRHGYNLTFWIAFPTGVAVGSGVAMLFAGIQLCINDISPSPDVLGTLNALALTITSAVRAFTPVCANSIFAAGVNWGWADGHLVWFFLVFLGLILIIACQYIPEKAEGRPKSKEIQTAEADDE